jgi:heme-degrading monooxygenase HmoA
MYFISVTRLRVRSVRFLPQFILANEASIKSIKKIAGFISGKELIDKGLTFWTVTLWESDQAMKYFRNNDPHKSAMRKLPDWCNEGAYVHWTPEDEVIPGWDILYKKLMTEGKLTKIKHPSAQQEGMNYPEILWIKTERPFKSALK